MISGAPNGDGCDDRPARPRRLTRYAGTYPRRFDQRYKELNPDSYPEIQEHVRAQDRTPAGTHVPVLVEEILAALRPGAGDIVVDCTIGYGGHAGEFLRRIGPTSRLIGLDVNALQLQRTAQRLGGASVSRGPRFRQRQDGCGACCAAARCLQTTETLCVGPSKVKYNGDGTTCQEACPVGIPAVSSWGIAVMTLLVLAAGTLVLTKRRSASTA